MENKLIQILEEEIRRLELKSYLIAQVLPNPEQFNRADKVIFVLQEAVLKLIELDNETDGRLIIPSQYGSYIALKLTPPDETD